VISVEKIFKALHQLKLPNGVQEPLHSHSWNLTVAVSAEKLDSVGFVMDFNELNAIINDTISPFENVRLEELDVFEHISCSAENIAKCVFDKIEQLLPAHIKLEYVKIVETSGCTATYTRSFSKRKKRLQ